MSGEYSQSETTDKSVNRPNFSLLHGNLLQRKKILSYFQLTILKEYEKRNLSMYKGFEFNVMHGNSSTSSKRLGGSKFTY